MTGVIAIVLSVTQILMKLLDSALGEQFLGKFKFLAVSFLSLVTAVAGGLALGQDFLTSLLSGAGLAAVQVFAHQFYLLFIKKGA